MTTRDAAPLGAPCWADLATTDIAASRAFYGELFGWTSEAAEALGGSVTMAPFDSPYGRMASVADTTGAAFMVVGRG